MMLGNVLAALCQKTTKPAPRYTVKIAHIVPHVNVEDLEALDTCRVEPRDEEMCESDWIEIDDREWSDKQLADDARPGRRMGSDNGELKLQSIVQDGKRLSRGEIDGKGLNEQSRSRDDHFTY
jgi:hypothetical protein